MIFDKVKMAVKLYWNNRDDISAEMSSLHDIYILLDEVVVWQGGSRTFSKRGAGVILLATPL